MKKKKIEIDYPIEDATLADIERLKEAGWFAESQHGDEVRFTRQNNAGMTTVKFIKIKI